MPTVWSLQSRLSRDGAGVSLRSLWRICLADEAVGFGAPQQFRITDLHQMLARHILVCLALVLAKALTGLELLAQQPNLVPNPSFEEFRVRPLGWYYKGAQYNRVMRYWRSPTAASPDAYNPDVRVPRHWAVQGFGAQTPHGGTAMSGITLYGCANGKPHCREYLQTQLIEPLVPGQRYRFSVWVAALPRSLRCNGLSAAFVETPSYFDDDRRLSAKPLATISEVMEPGQGWVELSTTFTASGTEHYLLIGNFGDDESTMTRSPDVPDPLPFAYYYVDEVNIHKLEPIVPIAAPANDLSRRTLRVGDSITLRDVYFDHDSEELQPRSFVELDKLVTLMMRSAATRVRIVGHTDNAGTPDYNEDLSQRRAATVVRYLEEHGIAVGRLDAEGRGQREPVATNRTAEGRQLNRRVVAVVE